MKPVLIILFVVVLGNVLIAEALRCYSCAGSKASDCYKGKTSSMVIQKCPSGTPSFHTYVLGLFNASSFQTVCVSLVETNTSPDVYVKGCAVLPGGVDPCDFLKERLPVSSCKFCSTDLCESSEEELMEFLDKNTV